ncbi:NmrA family NAD(P)-binding protein [Spirosoma sp. RP8]|uniref:NmrA family NAD(P)-binding protein n=1 Tax=Spirosoma liriopis TaxID=2937440 RepID=A0ABT0HTP0_9BACT|nr:NmrA family NAD(P)-binding protein [Spirosoma liriopis]MCK8495507.1 NmrA family NAD(P)-binding protein [Spirosoma liriopis]
MKNNPASTGSGSEKANVLIIGATGRVGSQVVEELDRNSDSITVRLSTTDQKKANQWQQQGWDSVVLDLDKPETFADALDGIDRIFLLTGYTVDMLRQSKLLVDAASKAGVSHIVHLGVFTSRHDLIPHFMWHDMVETYIEASGMAWTHLHPNVIADTSLAVDPPITEIGSFTVYWGDAPQGWVFASDIAAVAATVLREGPKKHGGANYYLSTEVLTGPQVAAILSKASGKEITCNVLNPDDQKAIIEQIPSVLVKAYMESAYITMQLAKSGQMEAQTIVKDDVLTVVGRPGLTMEEWARLNLV